MARKEDAVELEVDGHELRVTSPNKILFPERGETKLDLLHYYQSIAEPIMRLRPSPRNSAPSPGRRTV